MVLLLSSVDPRLRTNSEFVAEGRLRVVELDARHLSLRTLMRRMHSDAGGLPSSPLRGAILSNELPDAFAVEKLMVSLFTPPPSIDAGLNSANVESVGRRRAEAVVRLHRALVLPLILTSDVARIQRRLSLADAGAVGCTRQ